MAPDHTDHTASFVTVVVVAGVVAVDAQTRRGRSVVQLSWVLVAFQMRECEAPSFDFAQGSLPGLSYEFGKMSLVRWSRAIVVCSSYWHQFLRWELLELGW